MKNDTYDVAIIGAGINGLICAAYLLKAGLKVILLEARHETGGGLDTLEFAGFKYNTHAIYHLMADIMPVYHDFHLNEKGVKYIFPETQIASLYLQSQPVIFYHDPIKTSHYLSHTFSKNDGDEYTRMYNDFRSYSNKILIPLTYIPAMAPIDQIQLLRNANDSDLKRFAEIAELSPIEILEQYQFCEPVKASILNLYALWGLSPFDALGYLFPLYVYRMTHIALCSGGSHRLSSALHKIITSSGGKICDSSEVSKVIMTNRKVSGVLLKDGNEIKAEVVASTVDPKQNFLQFFNENEIPHNLIESTKKWEWEKLVFFGTHVSLSETPKYVGSDTYKDINNACINFFGITDTETLLEHIQNLENEIFHENTLLGHTTCASIFDPIQAPNGMHTGRWESLVLYNHDWDNLADDYMQKCLEEWKKYAPNLSVIHALKYPPTYIERKFKNMVRGSIKQGSYTPLQMGYFRPNESCSQIYTPIDGFYVCGASVYPGGMIIGGPGYIGANTIIEDFQIKKTWEEIDLVKKARINGLII